MYAFNISSFQICSNLKITYNHPVKIGNSWSDRSFNDTSAML